MQHSCSWVAMKRQKYPTAWAPSLVRLTQQTATPLQRPSAQPSPPLPGPNTGMFQATRVAGTTPAFSLKVAGNRVTTMPVEWPQPCCRSTALPCFKNPRNPSFSLECGGRQRLRRSRQAECGPRAAVPHKVQNGQYASRYGLACSLSRSRDGVAFSCQSMVVVPV